MLYILLLLQFFTSTKSTLSLLAIYHNCHPTCRCFYKAALHALISSSFTFHLQGSTIEISFSTTVQEKDSSILIKLLFQNSFIFFTSLPHLFLLFFNFISFILLLIYFYSFLLHHVNIPIQYEYINKNHQ